MKGKSIIERASEAALRGVELRTQDEAEDARAAEEKDARERRSREEYRERKLGQSNMWIEQYLPALITHCARHAIRSLSFEELKSSYYRITIPQKLRHPDYVDEAILCEALRAAGFAVAEKTRFVPESTDPDFRYDSHWVTDYTLDLSAFFEVA